MSESGKSVFCDSALLSGLVTQDQLERARAQLLSSAAFSSGGAPVQVSDDELAERLVQLRALTSYQADQLKSGRTKFNLGPYIITDWIGQGGMGQVFKAIHEVMGRESAVKVLPLTRATPHAIESFVREIRTQAQLDHPNLVRAYDAGQDGNVHFLVTEYVPGADLRRLVRSRGPLTMRQAASIIMQSARGLAYAHQRGLIHRDVKPGNVLVTPEGVAKVSDLGLAGFIPEAQEEDPRVGKIVGTADYLSPEQIKTPQFVDAVSDIYSLGCTLYYAITGKVPFPGGATQEKARRHCEETPWHPRRFNSQVSEEFVEIIADMMEKDPHSRIASAAEVADRLEPWASDPSPIASRELARSRWLPPPLPTGGSDADNLQETDTGSYAALDLSSGDQEGLSQISQGTEPVASAGQDTLPLQRDSQRPEPALLTLDKSLAARRFGVAAILIALAISIPTSLLIGGLLGFLLRTLLR